MGAEQAVVAGEGVAGVADAGGGLTAGAVAGEAGPTPSSVAAGPRRRGWCAGAADTDGFGDTIAVDAAPIEDGPEGAPRPISVGDDAPALPTGRRDSGITDLAGGASGDAAAVGAAGQGLVSAIVDGGAGPSLVVARDAAVATGVADEAVAAIDGAPAGSAVFPMGQAAQGAIDVVGTARRAVRPAAVDVVAHGTVVDEGPTDPGHAVDGGAASSAASTAGGAVNAGLAEGDEGHAGALGTEQAGVAGVVGAAGNVPPEPWRAHIVVAAAQGLLAGAQGTAAGFTGPRWRQAAQGVGEQVWGFAMGSRRAIPPLNTWLAGGDERRQQEGRVADSGGQVDGAHGGVGAGADGVQVQGDPSLCEGCFKVAADVVVGFFAAGGDGGADRGGQDPIGVIPAAAPIDHPRPAPGECA